MNSTFSLTHRSIVRNDVVRCSADRAASSDAAHHQATVRRVVAVTTNVARACSFNYNNVVVDYPRLTINFK